MGCRPVLLTFRNLADKQSALKSAKFVNLSPVSISEVSNKCRWTNSIFELSFQDVSKRTKESRYHLRKFLRLIKKNSPEKVDITFCIKDSNRLIIYYYLIQVTRLEYDVAYVDDTQFIYNEEKRMVEEVGISARTNAIRYTMNSVKLLLVWYS